MTEPDNLQFMHGHPMPTRDHATLLASHHLLLGLADECLPVRVRPTGTTSFFEEWEVTRAAFMARMASTLRHLGYLAPSYSRLDGLALARTLLDHVIAFAWISAEPKERLAAFLRSSFKDLLAKDKRYRERGDEPLLGDAERERPERIHPRGKPGDAEAAAAVVRGRRPLARTSPVLAARVPAQLRRIRTPVPGHLRPLRRV
jgi:hypothetical protein